MTTVSDLPTARRLSKGLIKNKLASCVSFRDGFASYYRWKGKLETSREVLLLIKTAKEKFSAVSQWLKTKHPYELPEVIALPVAKVSSKYSAWLHEALK